MEVAGVKKCKYFSLKRNGVASEPIRAAIPSGL
jgi:hypothetical protein